MDSYEGVYTPGEKGRRLAPILDTLADQWVLLVDSDEFLELPLESLEATIEALEHARADALAAPMVQRIRRDGSLDSPSVIADPFGEFPLCAPDLYRNMGVRASTDKFPLVRRGRGRRFNPGFHDPPEGAVPGPPSLRGVTHHFKWRAPVWERLRRRAESQHRYRHESIGYLDYLSRHGERLPLDRRLHLLEGGAVPPAPPAPPDRARAAGRPLFALTRQRRRRPVSSGASSRGSLEGTERLVDAEVEHPAARGGRR